MAFEQYFAKEWKSIPVEAADSEKTSSVCFDCNICLEFAHDPVVTLCGHLYCWPCIYKWFHFQSSSLASDEHPQCPVCKAKVSDTAVVPLYGRGQSLSDAEPDCKTPYLDISVPPRPPACGAQALVSASSPGQQLPYQNPYQNPPYPPQQYSSYEDDLSPSFSNLGGSAAVGASNPSVGMFGEMVYARVFGNSESLFTYPTSYHLVGSSSPRLRRREVHADKSLTRISIFLFCCFLLCLVLF